MASNIILTASCKSLSLKEDIQAGAFSRFSSGYIVAVLVLPGRFHFAALGLTHLCIGR